MSQKDIVWKINDLTLHYDFEDVNMIERYEKAFENMRLNEKSLKKDGNISDVVSNYCLIYWMLFDELFGEGTADKIFDSQKNARLCEDAYESFIAYAKNSISQNNQARVERLTRITGNRTARRNAEKQKRKNAKSSI